MGSPEPTALGLRDDIKDDQLPSRRDAASDLVHPRPADEGQSKAKRQAWLGPPFSKRNTSPSQTRLKWCGCFASSNCTHFTHSYALDTDIGSPSNQLQRFFVPEGSQHTHHQGLLSRSGCTVGEKRSESFSESFYRDIRHSAQLKAQILSHPMYEQMLAAHLGCLRVATPIDHLQTVEAQLATAHHVAAKYSMLSHSSPLVGEGKEELDRFMTTYIILLHNFKDQLQEHVRTHAMEAVLSCWELEQAFIALTGMPLGEGSGATMSDEEEEKMGEPGLSLYSPEFFSGHEHLGLGPLIPTESERSLLERVRQELKSELKQDYKNKIADVREEILRKRRAGKLPTETTAILKKWWNAHSKWPYPTEDEKARLVQETGLELKQINNWFINQRKRNWHSHSTTTSSTSLHIDHSSLGGGSGQASNVSLTVSSDTEKRPGDLHDADF